MAASRPNNFNRVSLMHLRLRATALHVCSQTPPRDNSSYVHSFSAAFPESNDPNKPQFPLSSPLNPTTHSPGSSRTEDNYSQ